MPITELGGYYDYAEFLRKYFDCKVQKIAVNAGFKCPNRDGTLGTGGCTYCNNRSFNPDYCSSFDSVTEQLEEGKRFFARKYPQMKYLAYFQAYTNTYGDISHLVKLYEEALAVPDVVGLIVATRPDCVSDELLDYFGELSKRTWVMIEYGVETSHNSTLKLINRGHSWETAERTIRATAAQGVLCGAHLILGLPGETEDDVLATADAVSALPLSTVKLHQLQIIRGTKLANQVADGEVKVMNGRQPNMWMCA
jgi:Predicted Fe-S oxidoreductase